MPMSHAEAVTAASGRGRDRHHRAFASGCATPISTDEVRYYARRHLLDTVGVMIAGAPGDVATNAETMLARRARRRQHSGAGPREAPRPARCRVPRRHGGAWHRARRRLPRRLGALRLHRRAGRAQRRLRARRSTGAQLIEAVVAGYEVAICLARACAPDLRQRGFHPTSAVGPFGAAVAVAKLRGLTAQQIADALGIAASASAGLFAFVNGGADIKRLHAGHASREGIQAALLARAWRARARPTWSRRATASCRPLRSAAPTRRVPIALPPDAPFGITDCYIKPYACCRHIQPAVEALFGLMNDEKIDAAEIRHVDVETYRIAAEHAHTGWDDYASAQLSFPYLMGLAARFRGIKVHHFNAETRSDPAFGEFAKRLTVTAPPEIDGLYPKLRPARVTVTTAARQVRAPGRRGARLAHRAARRCRA